MKTLMKSIMAGICISIGGIIYLSLENHVAGSFLFSIGLFTIYTFGFYLYTGKICYIPNEKFKYLGTVAIVYLGNAIGTVGMGYLFRNTKLSKLIEHTNEVVGLKLADTIFSTFIMSMLCGILMSIAVLGFQTVKDSVGKHLALILPIMVFILSGYEHSIADMFYFSFADVWGGKAFLYITVITLGNLAGGCFIPFMARVMDNEKLGCH